MDRPLTDPEFVGEVRAALAASRELLSELVDEGLDQFERVAFEPPVAPAPAATTTTTTAATTPTTTARTTPTTTPRTAPTASRSEAPAEPAATGDRPTLESVRALLGDCERCPLAAERKTIVFGDGNPNAKLMFVGEGPGEQEDKRGLPFVGRAGELLTQMIEKGLGIERSDVYICNIVKCRPPNNRTPLPNEVATCRTFLDGQIDAIRPNVIIALGKPAASLLLGRDVAITRIRGTWQQYRDIPVMPTLHPAYVLRQYTPENRRNVWEDLKAAHARSEA